MRGSVPGDYKEAVAYLEDLPRFTKKHTLEHTREFLKMLGSPGTDRKIIHVAGTNGKGSVCAYMQAVLEAEGKHTGFFTSPHLVAINERIQIDRKPIDDESFFRIFSQTLETVSRMEKKGMEHPSYFEFLFGMGMLAFAGTDVEYIILETGLGGRLDATNAPLHPFLTVITSISLDHTDILGESIQQIAFEKAGIIKPGVPVFYDGSSPQASEVIRRIAEERQAPCREISNRAFEILEVTRNDIAFSRKNAYDKDVMWKVPICGLYQVMNAEIALEAAEYALKGCEVHRDRWVRAIGGMRWEGRMEQAAPHLTVDGAHNPGALKAFAESVRLLEDVEKEPPVILFSAVSDKKYGQMISFLCQEVKAKAYIVTEIADRRRVPATELQQIFRQYTDRPVYRKPGIEEALRTAYEVRGDSEIYCLGSLYLVGMIKEYLSGGGTDVRL